MSLPRGRILSAASELFAHRGIRDVGVDELISASRVAKATFYRHFRSKDEVVLAFLGQWYRECTSEVDDAIARHGADGEEVLAVFDVFEGWFRQGDVRAGALLRVMIEMGAAHPLGNASVRYMEGMRRRVAELAEAAALADPDGFAWSTQILIAGAIVADAEGDRRAAGRAKRMAALLVEDHRGPGKDPRRPEN